MNGGIRIPPADFTLSTERLRLRAPSAGDIPHVLSAARVPGFNDGLGLGPHDTEEDLRRVLARNLDMWSRGSAFVFTAEDRRTAAFIGRTLVRRAAGDDVWNLAFWIHPEHQGRGHAAEAARATLGFAFDHLGAAKVEAGHVTTNKASRRVLDKLGMKEEAFLPRGLMKDGVWLPGIRMAITRSEWLASAPHPASA